MRPSELEEAIECLYPTRQSIYIWGPPGLGKSSIVKRVARKAGISCIDLRAVLLDPVDLRGLPHFADGLCKWAIPEFLPRDGRGIIFLDELAQAAPMVQAALLQLVLDFKLGEYTLPEGWTIIAASNRAEDRAGGHKIISSMQNRFLHLDLEPHPEDWQAWAIEAEVHPVVRGFIRFRPNLLFKFNPSLNERSFPSPRSWNFVSNIVDRATEGALTAAVAGCVGMAPASEFLAFRSIYRELPDIQALLKNPHGHQIPTRPDVLYATCSAITENCRGCDKATLSNAVIYANRMSKEFGVLLMRDLWGINKDTSSLPAAQAWLRENRHLINAA